MTDDRQLTFPDPDPRFDEQYKSNVVFDGRDRQEIVQCKIGRMALLARFGFTGNDIMKGYEANRAAIEHWARRNYLSARRDPDGTVSLRREDLVR